MHILVVGATGTLGGMIAHQLREQGHAVRALVRPGRDSAALEAAGIATVAGDLKDPPSLGAACAAADVVVTTANSARRGGADNVETVEIAGNRALIDAARAAGVRRFVFVSALGAAPDSPVPFMRGKGLAEAHLQASGLPYVIVKPNFFMDVWIGMIVLAPIAAGQPVTLVGEGRRKHAMISMGDVAAFTTAAVTHPAALNSTLLLGGPEAISWRDVIAAAERITGTAIEVRTVAPGQPLPGHPQVVADLAASLDAFDSPIPMTETAARFGVSLTPVEVFLRRALTQAAPA